MWGCVRLVDVLAVCIFGRPNCLVPWLAPASERPRGISADGVLPTRVIACRAFVYVGAPRFVPLVPVTTA